MFSDSDANHGSGAAGAHPDEWLYTSGSCTGSGVHTGTYTTKYLQSTGKVRGDANWPDDSSMVQGRDRIVVEQPCSTSVGQRWAKILKPFTAGRI